MERFTENYLLFLLAQSSHRASAEFHAALTARGVPVWMWRILASLYPEVSSSVSDLAASCLTKQPTMTRQVDRLVKRELVERAADPTDRRRVVVELTGNGVRLARELTTMAKAHERQVLDGLEERDVATLKRALGQLTDPKA